MLPHAAYLLIQQDQEVTASTEEVWDIWAESRERGLAHFPDPENAQDVYDLEIDGNTDDF